MNDNSNLQLTDTRVGWDFELTVTWLTHKPEHLRKHWDHKQAIIQILGRDKTMTLTDLDLEVCQVQLWLC